MNIDQNQFSVFTRRIKSKLLAVSLCMSFCLPQAVGQIFYVDSGADSSLRRIEADGSANSVFLDAIFQVSNPTGLIAPPTTGNLYFMDRENFKNVIKKVSYNGSDLELIVSETDLARLGPYFTIQDKFYVDGPNDHLYFTVSDSSGFTTLIRTELTSPISAVPVLPGDSPVFRRGAFSFQVDAERGKIYVETLDGLVRSNLDGSNPETIFVGDQSQSSWVLLKDEAKIALPHQFNKPEIRFLELDGTVIRTIELPISGIPELSVLDGVNSMAYDTGTKTYVLVVYDRRIGWVILSYDNTFSESSGRLIYIVPDGRRTPRQIVVAQTASVIEPPEATIELSSFLAFGIKAPTQFGLTYRIEFSDRIPNQTTAWTELKTIVGDGTTQIIVDPFPVTASTNRFYRAVVTGGN